MKVAIRNFTVQAVGDKGILFRRRYNGDVVYMTCPAHALDRFFAEEYDTLRSYGLLDADGRVHIERLQCVQEELYVDDPTEGGQLPYYVFNPEKGPVIIYRYPKDEL